MGYKIIDTGYSRCHGKCSLAVQNNKLSIIFPRKCFNGKQKTLSLGLIDTPTNRNTAITKLNSIQNDIDLGQFDLTLERYKPQTEQKDYQKKVYNLYGDDLLSLWLKYVNYKEPSLKESTIHYLETSVTSYLDKINISSPYQSLELRDKLLNLTTESMTKRILTNISAAFKWGLKHKLVSGLNPYEGMASEFKHQYEIETKPNAFTLEQKEIVLKAFKDYQGKKSVNHYFNFINFLFFTGCRPHEAIGLRWIDISNDFKIINFTGGIYELTSGKLIRQKGSKNNRKRQFPCNSKLQNFLQEIEPPGAAVDSLIFPSPKNKIIRYGNFCNSIWNPTIEPIKTDTTPYSCRDTFICEQIAKGVNPAIIALWVDSSTATIERHYLDPRSIEIVRE